MTAPRSTAVRATCLATGTVHTFRSIKEASLAGGFNRDQVSRCIRGTSRTHAGHTFCVIGKKHPAKRGNLTHKVAALRNRGLSNDAIANELCVSLNTARAYASRAVTAGLCESRKTGARIR